jgi:predicted PurR-regulated permease PerM
MRPADNGEEHDARDGQDIAAPAPAPNTEPPRPVVVPRWVQLVMLPVAALAFYALARAASSVLLLFTVAGVVALILNPLVSFLQRWRFPRPLAVAAVYLALVVVLAVGGALLANPVSNQAQRFQRDVPNLIDSANESLASVQRSFDDKGIGIEIKRPGETALQTLQQKVVGGTENVVSFGGSLLQTLVTASLGLILVVVLSIYFLVYGEQIGRLVRSIMPPGDGSPDDDYPTRVQQAVSHYVRGQFLFSTVMGASAGIGMYVYGVTGVFPDGERYAFVFGVFFGLMELVPFVGPVLGALPPIVVALFQDPLMAVYVTLFFVALQQLEGHVVAPQVFGHTLRINPLLVIFALLLGAEIYGVVGALLSLPIAAVLRETVLYLRRHLVLEPWGAASPVPVAGDAPPPAPRAPCPACGAAVDPGDETCPACGAASAARIRA